VHRRMRRSRGQAFESGANDLGPGGTNILGENQGVPRVDEHCAADVGENLCGSALAEDDPVYAGTLFAVGDLADLRVVSEGSKHLASLSSRLSLPPCSGAWPSGRRIRRSYTAAWSTGSPLGESSPRPVFRVAMFCPDERSPTAARARRLRQWRTFRLLGP